MTKDKHDSMSRRDFLKAAGVAGAAGATGIIGQGALSAADEQQKSTGAQWSGKPGKYMRSVLPPKPSKVRREIQEFVDQILIIDTHEHLRSEEKYLADPRRSDFGLFVSHYTDTDLGSAGMSGADRGAVTSPDTPLDKKWDILEPYWTKMRTTGYGWVKELVIRGFYGLDGLSRKTYAELTKRIQAAHQPGFYKRILKDAAGIERAILDTGDVEKDPTLFSLALRVDGYICIGRKADLARFEQLAGKPVDSPAVIKEAMHKQIADWKSRGIVAAKCAMAYSRTLRVENISDQNAQRALDAMLSKDDPGAVIPLQSYIFHQVLNACADNGMPLQIHTGILVGNNNSLERTNPLLIHEALAKHSNAKVDVFHAGYPWVSELGAMGKINTCVYADLCWAHAISPSVANRALNEWLDAMPASKILAFGGDYLFPEGSYGHSIIARTNVADVLANRVENGRMSMAEAKRVAQMVLRDNAKELFGLA